MEIIEEAELATNQGAYPQALNLWNQVEAAEPEERAYVGFHKAKCLMALNRLGPAFAEAQATVNLIPISSDLGQQIVSLLITISRLRGDLGKARVYAEASREALEENSSDCSLETLVKMAELRAELAREFGRPDDAEDTLADIIEVLDGAIGQSPEAELYLGKAKILEMRAHNRWLGHAGEVVYWWIRDARGGLIDGRAGR